MKATKKITAILIILTVLISCAVACVNVNAASTHRVRKTVVLFFDDGWLNQYVIAYPYLQRYGFKATFGVTTDLIGADRVGGIEWGRMNIAEIKSLILGGMEIASHSWHHYDLTKLTDYLYTKELVTSKKYLQDCLHIPIKTFIVPYSVSTPAIDQTIKEYYAYERTDKVGNATVYFVGNEKATDFTKKVEAMGDTAFICYHSIRRLDSDWVTDPGFFGQEMAWLYYNGYRVISYAQYMSNN